MENNGKSTWRTLKTVETATEIVEMLSVLDGAGVTELASRLDRSKSSVHSQLATLRAAGYLVKDGSEYRLSYQFLLIGEYVRNNSPLYQFGRAKANHLAAETGHYAHLFTEEKGLGINIYEARGEYAEDYDYQSLKLQRREPLHITASGKAVLAELPEERVKEIVDTHGLERYTTNTITDERALFEELATICERGYAVNDEEEVEGFRAIAAPVCSGDDVLGSVSVSGPTTTFTDAVVEQEVPERVLNVADRIKVDYNMSTQS